MTIKTTSSKLTTARLLLIGGVILTFAAALLAASPLTSVMAQDEDIDVEYYGARECRDCHRDISESHSDTAHALALQDASDEGAVLLGDFSEGQSVREVQLPGESEAQPFTADEVKYIVGAGQNVQRYLYQSDEGQLLVLPAEWNVAAQTWEPYLLADSWPSEAYDWTTKCAGCHTTGLDVSSGRWEDDGVQCEACHGPGSVHVELADDAGHTIDDEELAGIQAAIASTLDPQMCGQCHSQGEMPDDHLPFPTNHQPGEISLDGFDLVSTDDPNFWRASGHASQQNMQYNEWMQSGHAAALTTMIDSDYAKDTCLNCHSGDFVYTERQRALETDDDDETVSDPLTLATAQYGIVCVTCHAPHGGTDNVFDLVEDPGALCISCHQDAGRSDEVHHPVQEMFTGAQIVDEVEGVPSQHLTAGATCVTCHMPPTQQSGDTWYDASHLLLPAFPGDVTDGQPDSCTTCHTDLSPEYLQQFIDKIQTKVSDRLSAAQVAMASRQDLPSWVQEAVDFVAGDGSLGVHNYQYTTQLLDAVEVQLGITTVTVPDTIPVHEIEDPQDCAECHPDEHREWQQSPHANASLSQTFQMEYAASGQPSYCMSCHASGYDPRTEEYVFEGVVCSNCHYVADPGVGHPPGPVEVATNSAVCGRCHSGAHSPTYNEWLVSNHSAVGIDCVDCHTPHDNGLILDNVNDTCGSCHKEATVDDIHMGDNMQCTDCHMTRVESENGIQVVGTGHSMNIDPSVCAYCHGKTHQLSSHGHLNSEDQQVVADMENEVAQLQDTASQNLNTGIVGGAFGALALVLIVLVAIRLGRIR